MPIPDHTFAPETEALRVALRDACDAGMVSDLLFLERWELSPSAQPAPVLRVSQIRRANPRLADAIRREVAARTLRPHAPGPISGA